MSPFSEAPAFEWGHLGVMVIWMIAGAVVAIRNFHWEPVHEKLTTPRQRSRRLARR